MHPLVVYIAQWCVGYVSYSRLLNLRAEESIVHLKHVKPLMTEIITRNILTAVTDRTTFDY